MSSRITPVDILHTHFRRSFRGYAPAETDAFMRQVSHELEVVLTENAELRDRIVACERELAHYRSLEGAMHEALIMAQKSADEIRHSAKANADAQLQDAHNRVAEERQRLEALRTERRRVICDLRATLNAQVIWLDKELEQEPHTTIEPDTIDRRPEETRLFVVKPEPERNILSLDERWRQTLSARVA